MSRVLRHRYFLDKLGIAKTHPFDNVEKIILYLLDSIVFPFFFVFAHTAIKPAVN